MLHLTFSQRHLLREIKRVGVYDCTTIDNKTMARVRFLHSNGLLDAKTKTHVIPTGNGMQTVHGDILSVHISEAGRAYLSELLKDNVRWRITTAIAIFAAIGAYREELNLIIQAIVKLFER